MSHRRRSALARFRCGTAPVRLETGRYEGLPVERRTCFICPDSVESEQHVLLTCPLYDDFREDMFLAARQYYADFDDSPDYSKLQIMLSSELLVAEAARTCQEILSRRYSVIYRL